MNRLAAVQKYRGELILLVVTILAASGWLFSKYSLQELPPAGFISVRFLAAALLFLPFAYPQLRRLSREQFKSAVTVGSAFSLNCFYGCRAWVIARIWVKARLLSVYRCCLRGGFFGLFFATARSECSGSVCHLPPAVCFYSHRAAVWLYHSATRCSCCPPLRRLLFCAE